VLFLNPDFSFGLKTCVYTYTVSVFLRRNIKKVPEFAFIIQRNSLVNLQEFSGIIDTRKFHKTVNKEMFIDVVCRLSDVVKENATKNGEK